MPITDLQRERLRQGLDQHEAALARKGGQLSSSAARIHGILLEMGRDEKLLSLITDFVDSPEVAQELRSNPSAALDTRDIQLLDNVTIRVLGSDDDQKPILRFEIKMERTTILADWDPDVGPSMKLARAQQ
jgi:hypothetical protein